MKRKRPSAQTGIIVELNGQFYQFPWQPVHSLRTDVTRLVPTGLNGSMFGSPLPLIIFNRASGRPQFSNLGRLKLALAVCPIGRGVNVRAFVDFAPTQIEKYLIELIDRENQGILEPLSDPIAGMFLLRVIIIPLLCRGMIAKAAKESEESLLWMGPLAAFNLALERTLLERLCRRRHQVKQLAKPRAISGARQREGRKIFGYPLFAWFRDSPEGFLFWMQRFDQWRKFAHKSWDYYISKQSKDVRDLKGVLQEAAVLGVLKQNNALPEKWFKNWRGSIEKNSKSKQVFRRNSTKYSVKAPNSDLNTWLIEVWPLVLEYGWNYHDLQRVAASAPLRTATGKRSKPCDALKIAAIPSGFGWGWEDSEKQDVQMSRRPSCRPCSGSPIMLQRSVTTPEGGFWGIAFRTLFTSKFRFANADSPRIIVGRDQALRRRTEWASLSL